MGRNVTLDFSAGGGSDTEFLIGTITLEPTAVHEIGNRVVLPAPRSTGINAGVGVLEDVAISPEGPEPAWAYRATVRDSISGKTQSWLVGVPAGTTAIPFNQLTKFTTTIPPETTAGMMQNWADTAQDGATRAEDAADRAEAPTDLMNKNLIENLSSLTRGALDDATSKRGMPTADDGHEYVWLAGVIRNTGDGNGWQLLPESTNHRPINIDTIDTVTDASGTTGYIRVNYPDAVGSGGMTVAFLAMPDETLARHGFSTGTSVTQTYTDIRISQSAAMASDYVYYDGTKWVSYDGIFTPTFTAGKLTLTHAGVPLEAQYALNVESRGSTHEARVSTGAGENTASKITLNIFETPGSVSDYVYYDGANWQSQSGEFTGFSFSGGVLTMNHTQIATEGLQHVSVAGRGKILAVVSSATSPTGGTFVKIDFRDPATGDLITTPNTNMRAYVSHGGEGGRLAPVPTTDMRFYVSQGGGNRQIVPAQLDTIKYPGCNIWLYGVMGKAS